jgi:hypothetical protein
VPEKGALMRDQHSIGVWLIAAVALLFLLIFGAGKPVSEVQAAQNDRISRSFGQPLRVSVSVQAQDQILSKVVYRPVTVRTYQVITYQKIVRR